MISRESFVDMLDAIEKQYKRDYEIGGTITNIGDPECNNRFVFTTQLIDDALKALAKDTNDTFGHISYYVYETEFGAKADEMYMTLKSGRKVKFTDAGALWDWLLEEQ